MPSFADIEMKRRQLIESVWTYWLHHNLFSWQWWLLLCLTGFPWFLWWRMADKTRLLEISCYGFLIALFCLVLDLLGTNLAFWGYPQHLLSFFGPLLAPIDLTVLPVEHMLIYQYFPKWKSFILALAVAAVITAFMVEPLFVWGGLYQLYTWNYIYSVPLYILKAIIAKWLLQQILTYTKGARSQ